MIYGQGEGPEVEYLEFSQHDDLCRLWCQGVKPVWHLQRLPTAYLYSVYRAATLICLGEDYLGTVEFIKVGTKSAIQNKYEEDFYNISVVAMVSGRITGWGRTPTLSAGPLLVL